MAVWCADAGNGQGIIVDVVGHPEHLGRPGDKEAVARSLSKLFFFLQFIFIPSYYVYGLSNAASLGLLATFL